MRFLMSRRPASQEEEAVAYQSEEKLVTVAVFCNADQPRYTVLWEPTGDEFIVNPGDRYTFTFKGAPVREDWTDIAISVGSGWVYLGGENLVQHEVSKNGEVVW